LYDGLVVLMQRAFADQWSWIRWTVLTSWPNKTRPRIFVHSHKSSSSEKKNGAGWR